MKHLDFTIPKATLIGIRSELASRKCPQCQTYIDELDQEEGHCPDCLMPTEWLDVELTPSPKSNWESKIVFIR
jgi:hypothetical protein